MGQLVHNISMTQPGITGANGQFENAQQAQNTVPQLPSGVDANTQSTPSTLQQPSFQQAAKMGATPGGVNATSPGLSKAGKLVTLLTSGLQGALAGRAAQEQMIAQTGGRRAGGVGTGFEAGVTLPWQRAQQQAQAQLAQMGAQPIQTEFGQVPAAYLPKFIAPMMRQQDVQMTNQSREGIANQSNQTRQNIANQSNQTRQQLGRYQTTPVGLFDKQTNSIVPDTGRGIPLTPEMAQQYGFDPSFVGTPVTVQDLARREQLALSAAPTTRTTSDNLGVTSTETSRKQVPQGMPGFSSMLTPQQQAQGRAQSQKPAGAPSGGGAAPKGNQAASAMVDEIGQYRLNPTMLSRMMTKHPEILGMVQQKYPDWDQTTYNAKNKIATAYTSGPESRSIGAISTALGHAGELGDAIDGLHNSNLPILNAIANRLGVATGGDAVTVYNTIVHRLGPEITAAYVQGGGGEGERAANAEDFSASKGDQQLRSNLGITVKLLRSKIAAQEQQWNNTYMPSRPQDQFANRFLTPQAQSTLQKWGGGAYGGSQGATQRFSDNGVTYNIPSNMINAFKRDHPNAR